MREKILSKFSSLISDLRNVLVPTGLLNNNHDCSIDLAVAVRIRTEGLNLLRRAIGVDSDHYKMALNTDLDKNVYDAVSLLGILEAAKNDFEQGFLFDLRALVTADLLGDFMEQAETLLQSGYHLPAASLIGATLEDSLRKISDRHGVSYPEKTKLEALNIELAKAGVYDKLVQKRITALGDIRNNADHGQFEKFKREDVEDMLAYTRRFMTDYLG